MRVVVINTCVKYALVFENSRGKLGISFDKCVHAWISSNLLIFPSLAHVTTVPVPNWGIKMQNNHVTCKLLILQLEWIDTKFAYIFVCIRRTSELTTYFEARCQHPYFVFFVLRFTYNIVYSLVYYTLPPLPPLVPFLTFWFNDSKCKQIHRWFRAKGWKPRTNEWIDIPIGFSFQFIPFLFLLLYVYRIFPDPNLSAISAFRSTPF